MFSTKAVIVKKAFHDIHIDAVSLLALRMIFSLPFYLVAAFAVSSRKENVRMNRKQWLGILGLGFVGYYLSSLFDFLGLQYVSAGLERLILFLYPSFVVLINSFFFKTPVSKYQKISLLVTYAGILLAFAGETRMGQHTDSFYWGCLLIFMCAITFSIYTAGSGRMVAQIGATKFTAYAMLAATTGVLINYALAGNYGLRNAGGNVVSYGLILALVATVIPSFLISLAMKKIGSSNVAIISTIGPVSTILQAHLILGEPIFLAQILGTALVTAGILITALDAKNLLAK
jgi:drug/metabolite transporter (DMT)-like permease